VQDPGASGPEYSGIAIEKGSTPLVARGHELTVVGTLGEPDGLAQLVAEDITITGVPGAPDPVELPLGTALDEAYQSVLVRVSDGVLQDSAYDCSDDDASCTDADLWTLWDKSDVLIVYDGCYESEDWTDHVGDSPLTGVMTWRWGRSRLMPRSSGDF